MVPDIFCKIIKGEISTEVVWQDDDFIVIKDIAPQAPVHLLIVPKKHFEALHDFTEEDASLLGKALLVAEQVAKQAGVHEKGYRLIINEVSMVASLCLIYTFICSVAKILAPNWLNSFQLSIFQFSNSKSLGFD